MAELKQWRAGEEKELHAFVPKTAQSGAQKGLQAAYDAQAAKIERAKEEAAAKKAEDKEEAAAEKAEEKEPKAPADATKLLAMTDASAYAGNYSAYAADYS
eukprot:12651239-Heterocapsa_arctica.AAC.1